METLLPDEETPEQAPQEPGQNPYPKPGTVSGNPGTVSGNPYPKPTGGGIGAAINQHLASGTTEPIGAVPPQGGGRGGGGMVAQPVTQIGGRGGYQETPETTELQRPVREREAFESAQEAGPGATAENVRAEAQVFKAKADSARNAGNHALAAQNYDRVAKLGAYADALEQTRDVSGRLTSAFLGPILQPFPEQEKTIAEAQQPGTLPTMEEQQQAGVQTPVAAREEQHPATDLLINLAGTAPYFELGGYAGRALGAGLQAGGEALQVGGGLARSGIAGKLGTAARSIGEGIEGMLSQPELPKLPLPTPETPWVSPSKLNISMLHDEVLQFEMQLPARVRIGMTQGQIVGAGISYREARLRGASVQDAVDAAVEGLATNAAFGVVSHVGTGALAGAIRGAAAVTGGVVRGTSAALAARLQPAEAHDAVTQMQLLAVADAEQATVANERDALVAQGAAKHAAEQRALPALAVTPEVAAQQHEENAAREMGYGKEGPPVRFIYTQHGEQGSVELPNEAAARAWVEKNKTRVQDLTRVESAEELDTEQERQPNIANVELTSEAQPGLTEADLAPLQPGTREHLTNLYARHVIAPIMADEHLPPDVSQGLGTWISEGLMGAHEAARLRFPPETDRATIERVLQRAAFAGKQAGLFHAVADPEGSRHVVELDVGRPMTAAEYRAGIKALMEGDRGEHFGGSTLIQLQPSARIQVVLNEGRDASDAQRVVAEAQRAMGADVRGTTYPGTVLESATASDRARLAGVLSELGGHGTPNGADSRAALWYRGLGLYARGLETAHAAIHSPLGSTIAEAAKALGLQRTATLALIPTLAQIEQDKDPNSDRKKLLGLGALVVAGLGHEGEHGGGEGEPTATVSKGFVSRLAKSVEGIEGKKWDAGQPAADWIRMLQPGGKAAANHAKAEFELIRPSLDAAAANKRPLTRDQVLGLIEDHGIKLGSYTLADSGEGGGTHGYLEDIENLDLDPDTANPQELTEQVRHREERIQRIEDNIQASIDSARESVESAQKDLAERREKLGEVLKEAGLDPEIATPAIESLEGDLEGSDGFHNQSDSVRRALRQIEDDLHTEVDPHQWLTDNGYTIAHELEDTDEPERRVRVTHSGQGPQGESIGYYGREVLPDGRFVAIVGDRPNYATGAMRPDAEVLERARELYGPDATIERVVLNADEIARQKERAQKVWVVRDPDGDVVERDQEQSKAIEQAYGRRGPGDLKDNVERELDYIADYMRYLADNEATLDRYENSDYFEYDRGNAEKFQEEIERLQEAREDRLTRLRENETRGAAAAPTGTPDPYLDPFPKEEPFSSTGASSYQRVGGGKDYREHITTWENAPSTLTHAAYGSHDYWGRLGMFHKGIERAIGHVRAETHTIPVMARESGLMEADLSDKPEDTLRTKNLKERLRPVRAEQEEARAKLVELDARLMALPPEQRQRGELSSEAMGIVDEARQWVNTLNMASTREGNTIDELPGPREDVSVMLETQASLAQHQVAEAAQRGPAPKPEELDAARARLEAADRTVTEPMRAAYQEARNKIEFQDGSRDAFSGTRMGNLYFTNARGMLRSLDNAPDAEAWITEMDARQSEHPFTPEERALLADYWQKGHEYLAAKQEQESASESYQKLLDRKALHAKAAELTDAISPLGTDVKTALGVNAARFLIEEAKRGSERIAWSDAANRISLANLEQGHGGSSTAARKWYDEFTPAAMKRLLKFATGEDVKIHHISIRGYGHWYIDLTPEMRRAIRRIGLPFLALVAATALPTQEAQAQGQNPYAPPEGAPTDGSQAGPQAGGHGLAVALGSGLALAVAAGAVAAARGRAARLGSPALTSLLASARTAVDAAEKAGYTPARPSFLFPRREPQGTEYTAPTDVSDTPSGKGAANFNIAKLGLSPEGAQMFRDIVDKEGITKRTVTQAETEAEAARRATDPEGLLTQPKWTGTDGLAARMFQKQAIDRLELLAARDKDPATPSEDRPAIAAEMARITADVGEMGNKLAGERSAAGRNLNAYKYVAAATLDESTWGMLATRAKQQPLTTDEQLQIRQLINAKDREGLTTFVSDLHKSSLTDKLLTWWKTNLLGVSTVLKVAGSHAIEQANQIVDRPIATGVDALVAALRGTPRELSGVGPQLGPRLRGLVKGWKEGVAMIKSGETIPPEEAVRFDMKDVKYDSPILNAWVHTIHTVHNLAYRPFYHAALDASLDELSDVYAKRAVAADPSVDLKTAKAALLAQPSNEMALKAIDQAERAVYQNKGTLAQLGSSIINKARELGTAPRVVAETAVPFVKIPANIGQRALDASPLGLVTAALRASGAVKTPAGVSKQARFARDMARVFTGTAGATALGYWLASKGLATGDYPSNPEERNLWEEEGRQAHSVKLKGRWWNAASIGPQGMGVALGAQLHDMLKANPGNATKVAQGMVFATGKTLADQPFLRGISSGLDALNDPARAGDTYLKSQGGSMVPSMVARAAHAVDPVRRAREGVVDEIKSRIPFVSKTLPPRVSPFGHAEIENTTGRAIAVPSPVQSTLATEDPTTQELARLDVGIPGAATSQYDATGARVTTSPEERRSDLVFYGPLRQEAAQAVINDARYGSFDDATRKDLLRRALDLPGAANRTLERLGKNFSDLTDEQRQQLISKVVGVKVAELIAEIPVRAARQTLTRARRAAAQPTVPRTPNPYPRPP